MLSRFFISVLLLSFTSAVFSLTCVDHEGNAVDWYAVYKLPRDRSAQGLVKTGSAYVYLTDKTVSQGWLWMNDSIASATTPFFQTLKPYYDNDNSNMWMLYNDQMTGATVKGNGHTKGVVAAGEDGGFWLVQSIPHYPPNRKDGYSYPSTGYRNGQSALCLTLPVKALQAVGTAMQYNSPDVYDFVNGPASMSSLYSGLKEAAGGTVPKSPPWYIVQNITTKGGIQFTAFSKADPFNRDLYDLVASNLEINLLVEAWRLEWRPLPSSCESKFKIFNVNKINMDGKVTFTTTHDHSKWAIGQDDPWTCIGDINRAVPQESRGGGTVCLYNHTLWNHYKSVISGVDPCPKKKKWWQFWKSGNDVQ